MINGDDLLLYAKIGIAITAALYTAFKGRSWIKRVSSQDSVSLAGDGAVMSILKKAQEEAERARLRADKAFEERNAAVEELGSLRAQVASLERHRTDCERRLLVLEDQLNALRMLVDRRLNGRE